MCGVLLWGCVDSDWAGDTDTRCSFTGRVRMFNRNAVSWISRRQDSYSLSPTEAGFVAASQCGQVVLSLHEIQILSDFHQPQQSPTILYQDNLECIAMSETAVRQKSYKCFCHIDVRRYFVRKLAGGGLSKLVLLRDQIRPPPYSVGVQFPYNWWILLCD